MPIVDISLVQRTPVPDSPSLAQSLADALGTCFEAAPGRVWVRLDTLAASHYAENAMLLTEAELPVFVRVLHGRLPEGGALKSQAQHIARVVAGVTDRPVGRVHVEFAPAGAGRIAFGGELIE